MREPLGVTMDAKRLGSAAVSALEAAAMDLAVMQVMACGNDYLDKVGGARLDPGNGEWLIPRSAKWGGGR